MIRIPTFSEIMAVAQSRGAESEAPHHWNGLVGYWPMQEGGGATAFDASGFRKDGTLTNMAPASDRVVTEKGRAIQFGGAASTEHIALGTAASLNGSGPFTVRVLSTVPTTAARCAAVAQRNGGFNGAWKFGIHTTTSQLFLNIYNGGWQWGADWNGMVSASAIDDGGWHDMVGIRDGTEGYLYDDGALVGTASGTNRSLVNSISTNIGWDARQVGEEWQGQIALVQIWERALAAAEIQQLYVDPWAMGRLRSKVFAATAATAFVPYPYPRHELTGGLAT